MKKITSSQSFFAGFISGLGGPRCLNWVPFGLSSPRSISRKITLFPAIAQTGYHVGIIWTIGFGGFPSSNLKWLYTKTKRTFQINGPQPGGGTRN